MPNPVFPGWYADPEIHHFEGRFFIYPTYSAPYEEQTFFQVFSSKDLVEWTSEGVILNFAGIPWSTNRAAWAPSVATKDGRYYIYFSAGDGAGLGVAVSDQPTGPFIDAIGKPLVSEYHHGAQPIDAHAFLDDDGQAYLYWGGHSKALMAKLKSDMISLAEAPIDITPADYVEGPFMLKHQDKYYFMWSEGGWGDPSYRVAYAIAASPYGPFERVGVVLQTDPTVATSAGHHSVLRVGDRHVICYHRRPLTETSPHHRVTCLEWMDFDGDGKILPVKLTNEGVG